MHTVPDHTPHASHSLDPLVTRPTLLLDRARAQRNIQQMMEKARRSAVRFRPHFKTHQSAIIGSWFRTAGVRHITVSSVEMATYFAAHGWDDITIAFPVNLRELARIQELAATVRLGLLVEDATTVHMLGTTLSQVVDVWIKVDVGYGRTGIVWHDLAQVASVAQAITTFGQLQFLGLLTHAGHSYAAPTPASVTAIYQEMVTRLHTVQSHLQQAGFPHVLISIGDTPSCSIVEDFQAVDEVRPGNFVFYDLMQLGIGACQAHEIAVAVACPVVAKHPARSELVLYGGAVHLSKDMLRLPDGRPCFGQVAPLGPDGWGTLMDDAYVTGVSQEHGIVAAPPALLEQAQVGDLLMVVPVHACLTADAMQGYLTLDGEHLAMMAKA